MVRHRLRKRRPRTLAPRRRHGVVGALCAALLTVVVGSASAAPEDARVLRELSLEQLMDLPVSTVSREEEAAEDAPGIVSVIRRAEIEAFDARTLGELLNKVTSTVFLTANVVGENLVSIRRQANTPYDTHVLVLLDGRPVRDPLAGGLNQTLYAALPVEVLDSIEVVRGPGSVLYGSNAYAGVINLRTRRVDDPGDARGAVGFTAGSFGALGQQASVVGRRGNADFVLGLAHWREDGPRLSFTDYVGVDSTAAWRRETTGLLARVDTGNLRASFYHGVYAPLALNGPDNAWMRRHALTNGRSVGTFANLGASRDVPFDGRLDLDLTWNHHRWHTTDSDQVTELRNEADDLLLEATAHLHPNGARRILFGGTLQYSDWSGGTLAEGDEVQSSLYAQVEQWWGQSAKFIAGAQWNKLEGVDGNLSPRLGVVLRPSSRWGAKLLYSEAFRSGSRLEESFDHPVFRGNETLAPEVIDTWEAQLFAGGERAEAALTGYLSRASDNIERIWVLDPTDTVYGGYLVHVNGGRHDYWGLELEGRASPAERWWFTGSASWMRDEDDDGRNDYALHARWMAKAGVVYRHPRFTASVFQAWFGDHGAVADFDPSVPSPNPEAEDHALLSARLRTDLFAWTGGSGERRLVLSVWGENLLDRDLRYPEFTTRGINTLIPLRGGRAGYASLSLGF